MQETLNRLQQEKLSRAEALHRAISRKNNQSQLAGRRSDFSLTSGSQRTTERKPSEGRRSRSKLRESFLSHSSRHLSRSVRNSHSRSRNNSNDDRLMQHMTTGTILRSKPRLCELQKFQDSVMNASELLPVQMKAGSRNEGGPPKKVSSIKSDTSMKRIRAQSRSSSERTQKQAKSGV